METPHTQPEAKPPLPNDSGEILKKMAEDIEYLKAEVVKPTPDPNASLDKYLPVIQQYFDLEEKKMIQRAEAEERALNKQAELAAQARMDETRLRELAMQYQHADNQKHMEYTHQQRRIRAWLLVGIVGSVLLTGGVVFAFQGHLDETLSVLLTVALATGLSKIDSLDSLWRPKTKSDTKEPDTPKS